MSDKHPLLNKNVGIATAIGAGLGAMAGGKSNQMVSSVLFGAGVGAFVGWLGGRMESDKTEELPPSESSKDKGKDD